MVIEPGRSGLHVARVRSPSASLERPRGHGESKINCWTTFFKKTKQVHLRGVAVKHQGASQLSGLPTRSARLRPISFLFPLFFSTFLLSFQEIRFAFFYQNRQLAVTHLLFSSALREVRKRAGGKVSSASKALCRLLLATNTSEQAI